MQIITFIKYILVGSTSYLIELTVLYLLIWTGKGEVLAVGIAFWVGFIIAFFLQKVVTFNNKEKHVRALAHQGISYTLLVAFNYVFTLLLVQYTHNLIGVFWSRTIALIVTTTWNFVAYKYMFKV